ncbi:hypothetical protein ACM42_12820 [Bradyrhizobium sp. CCBAU 25338]|nr:hypothetical protein [Bradyrhizobium sp. CCBAU 25338]
MDQYAGLAFRDEVVIDTAQVMPPVTNSYGEFRHRPQSLYRPVGLEATTLRMKETVDTSVFERWRADLSSGEPPRMGRPAARCVVEGLGSKEPKADADQERSFNRRERCAPNL